MTDTVVIKCSDKVHRIECAEEVAMAIGRYVQVHVHSQSIREIVRQYVMNPCYCHVEAFFYMATEFSGTGKPVRERVNNVLHKFMTHITYDTL